MLKKLKSLILDDTIYMAILLVLTAVASFGLGGMSISTSSDQSAAIVRADNAVSKNTPNDSDASLVSVNSSTTPIGPKETTNQGAQNYVASKSGTKYHALTCPGAKQIKETNKIYFVTENEAEAAGYTKAANCKF